MKTIQAVETIRQKLKLENDLVINPIDLSLPVIPPFRGKNEIKLIILGQDPTVKNVASRKKITCTLNLDKNDSLKTYVKKICIELGITIDHVYATNLFKYFYTIPPSGTMEILINHLQPNLELLQLELDEFKDIPVITLGEPVLRLITNESEKVRTFWDFNNITKTTGGCFTYSKAKDNLLNRDFFPFPHQPSIGKEFYKNTLSEYLQIVRIKLAKDYI
jgi:uracil-DNA glycosylase